MTNVSFEEVAEFVRSWARVPKRIAISPQTRFEQDLGITGDDGGELLEGAAKRFNVRLASEEYGYRKSFNLEQNEYLFHPEGMGLISEMVSLFHTTVVRDFCVGELHEAIRRELSYEEIATK